MAELTGDMLQVPSSVSAIKIDGKRSYARVRAGEDVVLPARPVTVHRFVVLASRVAEADGQDVLDLDVEVEVSSGTYVRALARDLGGALGVGGHLTALRRTRVGRFDLATASTMEQLQAARDTGDGVPLVPLADAARAPFAPRELSAAEATAVGPRPADPLESEAAAHRTGGGLRPRRRAGGHAGRARHAGEGPRRVRPLGFVECPPCSAGRTSPRSPRASVRAS